MFTNPGADDTLSRQSIRRHHLRTRLIPFGVSIALVTPLAARALPTSDELDRTEVAQTWIVKNCDDSGPDSLRDIITNPAKAKSGDIVDLSELPLPSRCGVANSRITLTSGEIAVSQQYLTLQGPDHTVGSVTISGNGASRVLNHVAGGALSLYSLTISDGLSQAHGWAEGGCVHGGAGRISLHDSTVRSCIVNSETSFALGGGIFSEGDVELVRSTVSDNQAIAPLGDGSGGGVFTQQHLSAKYSAISNNEAHVGTYSGPYGPTYGGGGIYARGGINIFASTFNNNRAGTGSALSTRQNGQIINSTVSGNIASVRSAVFLTGSAFLIANSTIVLNKQEQAQDAGGVFFGGYTATVTLELESSIIAQNTISSTGENADLFVEQGVLAGSNNLVTASSIVAPSVITLSSPPRLGPLQRNGGRTLTHMPMSDSPALGQGNMTALPPIFRVDQRGSGYPRMTGINASVDLGAVQFDTIFIDGLDLLF